MPNQSPDFADLIKEWILAQHHEKEAEQAQLAAQNRRAKAASALMGAISSLPGDTRAILHQDQLIELNAGRLELVPFHRA